MTFIWITVIVVVVLYSFYLIWFNRNWCLVATTFTDEECFKVTENLRLSEVKFFTKIVIDWDRPPGQRTIIDHKQVDFYVRRKDQHVAKQALSRKAPS
ncbi:hypothetical protein ACF5W4_08920 [Bacillota bacterium Lsc_1132]